MNEQSEEIVLLRTKNKKLKYDLDMSERIRNEMQARLNAFLVKDNPGNLSEKLMNLTRTQYIGVQDDEKAGFLWNLTDKTEELKILDRWLVNIKHSTHDGLGHPVAIPSEEELKTLSHPTSEYLKSSLTSIDDAICCNTSRIGHLVVPREEAEIAHSFAGVEGNLSWFNSGDSPILLRLETAQANKSIILDPGFGLWECAKDISGFFCLQSPQQKT